jgi:sulfite exporter TauE/SafE
VTGDAALLLSALALGAGSAPHCALMCGTPCAAAGLTGRSLAGFLLARGVSYAAAGAAVAWAVASLGQLATSAAALRPAWVMLHAAVMVLGLWMLIRGRVPLWMDRRVPSVPTLAAAKTWQPMRWAGAGAGAAPASAGTPGRRSAARWTAWSGLGWAAWPCGMLQSALVMAMMSSGPTGGAAVMGAFALASAPGLVLAPWLLAQARRRWGDSARVDRALARVAGGALAAAAVWALAGPTGQRVLCLT